MDAIAGWAALLQECCARRKTLARCCYSATRRRLPCCHPERAQRTRDPSWKLPRGSRSKPREIPRLKTADARDDNQCGMDAIAGWVALLQECCARRKIFARCRLLCCHPEGARRTRDLSSCERISNRYSQERYCALEPLTLGMTAAGVRRRALRIPITPHRPRHSLPLPNHFDPIANAK